MRARHSTTDRILESARLFEFLYGKQILKGYEWGRGERVVLLVHGWESRGTALRSFVPALLKKGFRVVTFDGPAHGNSAGNRTNLPHFAGAVRAIINHLEGVYGIITHSFGGASTVFALSYLEPEARVEKMTLIAPPKSMTRVFDGAVETMALPRNVARYFKKILEGKVGNRPLEDLDLSGAYGLMQVEEVLLVHDQQDPMVPYSGSVALLEHWPNAQLLATKGFGHYRLMKNPDLVQRVTEFMS